MKRRSGFTLIELLIVIIVIAVMAGVMMVATSRATDRAEATRSVNDVRNLVSAGFMFYIEESRRPTVGDEAALEERMNRNFDRNRYDSIVLVISNDRGLIGFSLNPDGPSATVGVMDSMASNAHTTGLVCSNGVPYTNGGYEALMYYY